jgi:ketosteroid isomerase-like protein
MICFHNGSKRPAAVAVPGPRDTPPGPVETIRGLADFRPFSGRRIMPQLFSSRNVLKLLKKKACPGSRYGHTSAGRGTKAVSDRATRKTVRELYDAYARRDFERVAAFVHDDIDWVIYGPIAIFPFAGPRHGRAAVLAAMGAIAEHYSLESHRPEITIVEGERAAVIADVTFIQRATNRTLRFRVANFLRFQDGKLIEFREFANSFDVVEQALGRELEL